MATLSTTTAENSQNLLDRPVLDQSGTEIGTVHSFWADTQSGNLEFIGVKTGWLFGANHVVPVEKAEVDGSASSIRLPYTSDFIKGAPSVDADATISDEQETEIYRYYGTGGSTVKGTATGHTTESVSQNATATAATGAAAYASGTAATTGAANTARTATGKDDIEVALTEEQVRVGKRTVDAGQVRLRKIVRTEIVNQPVEIRHEDVVIERVAAGDVRSGTATSDFKEETIDVPLTREEVVVQKDAHVTGAVRLHKTEGVETQQVSETVRKEDVEVVRDGKTVTEADTIKK